MSDSEGTGGRSATRGSLDAVGDRVHRLDESLDPLDSDLGTPNCDRCLHRMEPAATLAGTAYWACPVCGQTRIA